MKALAILSSTPDIVFFTADDEYLDQLEAFAVRQGMSQVRAHSNPPLHVSYSRISTLSGRPHLCWFERET